MDYPEKLATQDTQDKDKQNKDKHSMCWTPLCANKHKKRKLDINPPTNNCR